MLGIHRCILNIYSMWSLDKNINISDEIKRDTTINLDSFLINLYGCFDDLAYVWVNERPGFKEINKQAIGLMNQHKEIRRTFSRELQNLLKKYDPWLATLKDRRDSLAHRVPPYIPPYQIAPENQEKHRALEEEYHRVLISDRNSNKKIKKLDDLKKSLESLRIYNNPTVGYSSTEGVKVFVLHPQLINDWKALLVISEAFLNELKDLKVSIGNTPKNDWLNAELKRKSTVTSIDVSNYFTNKAIDQNRPLTVTQALKMAYMAQGYHLSLENKLFFKEKTEAWRHGPVIRELYDYLIEIKTEDHKIEEKQDIMVEFKKPQINILDVVFGEYSVLRPWDLSMFTNENGTPWDRTYEEKKNKVIDRKLMKKHFKKAITPDSFIILLSEIRSHSY